MLVARAAVRGEVGGPAAGLALLDALPEAVATAYQPYWAVRASLLARTGLPEPARAAFGRAIALSEDPAARAWLERTRDAGG